VASSHVAETGNEDTLDSSHETATVSREREIMKAYVITTGTLFTLVAFAHLLRTISEWSRLGSDPGFIVEGPGLGLIAAAIGIWAWRLVAGGRPS